MDWVSSIFIFFLGTIFGSFTNVLIYRLPREESIISPGSHCPHCETPIPFYRNIPVISFMLLGGKCATCKKNISIRYPFVEVLNGVIWVRCFTLFPPVYGGLSALFATILITLAWIDYQTMFIPLSLVISGLILIISGLGLGVLDWQSALWGAMAGVFIPLTMMGITYIITKRQGMGWGDIQLGLILGAWLGPLRIILTLFIAAALALLVWVGISIFKGFDKNRPLPFAPYLVAGALSMILLSPYFGKLFDKYLLL